ncbi:MAG: glycosyltransferase [Verrucomicrobiota bacterium]|nr:glycosyltransferase [Verrucomicrobiota bacterium]
MEKQMGISATLSSPPLVSILMPVYNAEEFLAFAVDSLRAQTFSDWELIAVNDGSTDRSQEILMSYNDPRIRVVTLAQNAGIIGALNAGVKQCRGQYIARQDGDDVSYPTRLEKQLAFFEKQDGFAQKYVIVGSACDIIDSKGDMGRYVGFPKTDVEIRWHSLFNNPFAHTSIMIRRSAIKGETGPYKREALHVEDYDLWAQLLGTGYGFNLKEALVGYRVGPQQISQKAASLQESNTTMISQKQLAALGFEMSTQEVEELRRFVEVFPERVEEGHIAPLLRLMQIADEFACRMGHALWTFKLRVSLQKRLRLALKTHPSVVRDAGKILLRERTSNPLVSLATLCS